MVDDQEHPSNALPWLSLRRRGGRARGLVGRASLHRGRYLGARGCTRLVALSWVQYATGLRSDIAELGRRAARGIWLVVTAYRAPACCARGSTTGAWTRSCAAHRGLLGPLGVGFLHLSPALLDALDPPYLGPSGGLWLDKSGPGARRRPTARNARRLETGNLNYPGIAGWAGALDRSSRPTRRASSPVLELSRALADGLRAAWA